MRRLQRWLLFFGVLFAGASGPAWAALQIEIIEGLESATPIAVARFGQSDSGPAPPESISAIIAGNLARSGRFAPLRELPQHPVRKEDVRWSDWRRLRVGNLVIGMIGQTVQGGVREFQVDFRLFDTFTAAQLAGQRYSRVRPDRLRWVAHRISDDIYYALTGEAGAFATRIAYVTESAGQEGDIVYGLNVSDSDGGNPVVLRTSPDPIMSPAWSPDGRWLAYVSFEGGSSRIMMQELATGLRREVTGFPGINGAPAFSPDGRRLALTLSRDGSPDIYVLDLESGELRRLTNGPDIDTEPAWSPDGRTLVFTSDRSGGRPQLFRIPAAGGTPERLTFSGRYNARAAFSPDGSRLAFVHEFDGEYRIAIMTVEDEELQVLTNGRLDESPTFAPNGRLILYATTERGRSALAAVSIDGRFRQRLSIDETGVRDPAWSPRLSRR